MRYVMVRYTVKLDRAQENERYVRAVFEALERERPAGLHYASFKQDDGVSFVHIACIDAPDGSNPLPALAEFRRFTEAIRDRCEHPPVAVEMEAVGTYRLFGAAQIITSTS